MKRRQVMDFLNATRFLLFAGLFITVGVLFIVTYTTTDIDRVTPSKEIDLIYKRPHIIKIPDLKEGDEIYIEITAEKQIDVMVADLDMCVKYIEGHDDFEPYALPESAYKIKAGTDETVKVLIDEDVGDVGVIFQRTLATGYDPINVKYKVSYPNHTVKTFCIPIAVILIAGGVALLGLHFYWARKRSRFEPMEDPIQKEIEQSREIQSDKFKEGKKKGKGPKKPGSSKMNHSSKDSSSEKSKGAKGKKK